MLAEVFFPTFSRLFAEDRPAFRVFGRRVARVLFGLTVPLATGAIVLAPAGVDLIYGGEYAGAVTSFRILGLDLVLRAGLTLAGAVLLVSDREQRFMSAIGMGALLNLALNFLLIPVYSLNGAAIATVASEALVLLLMGLWTLRIEALPWLQAFLLPLLASAGMAIILRFVPADHLMVSIAAGLASYALLLVLIGGLRRQDIDFLRRSVPRRGGGN
jgi:O-antigen/teichoic acid export membrane protein